MNASHLVALILVATAACAAGAQGLWLLYNRHLAAERSFPIAAERAIADFAASQRPARSDYERLAAYFIEGFLTYSSSQGGLAHYPGLKSGNGARSDGLEGFSRMAPVLATLASQPGSPKLTLPSGRKVDVTEILARGVTAGTNPASPDYWGEIAHYDQRIVEAADIALALWLARDTVWHRLPVATRAHVVTWLSGVNGRRTVDNNWHLFVAQVNVVLKALGERYRQEEIVGRLARVGQFHLGDGWFRDGSEGEVDYYNAWGFHYHLLWLGRIDPTLGADLARPMARFAQQLLHLFGPNGMPAMGRSMCYRLAATAPLIQQSALSPSPIDPRQARRALDLTWRFFLANGAARRGRITQGYCGDDPSILQSYSGPASCLWSLRSLVAALAIPAEHPFWTEVPRPLPVEMGNFDVRLPAAGLRVVGTQATGNVRLVVESNLPPGLRGDAPPGPQPRIRPYTLMARLKDLVDGGIRRPDNEAAAYRAAHYDSNAPFCTCPGLVLIRSEAVDESMWTSGRPG